MSTDYPPFIGAISEKQTTLPENTILLCKMGDFWEALFEDAKIVSRVCDVTLTFRHRKPDVPMCGFPYHMQDSCIHDLSVAGYNIQLAKYDYKTSKLIMVDL